MVVGASQGDDGEGEQDGRETTHDDRESLVLLRAGGEGIYIYLSTYAETTGIIVALASQGPSY